MNAQINKDTSEKGVPYLELYITDDWDEYTITFRKYYKNVFVAVEDNRDNQGGVDLMDLWVAPAVLIEKTPIELFDPFKAFSRAMIYLGDTLDDEISQNVNSDRYAEIEAKVNEWLGGDTI